MKGGKVMTKNQIDYAKHIEDQRHNIAVETETNRNNVAGLAETNRYNTLTTTETGRHNVAYLGETNRHNIATEKDAIRKTSINLFAQNELERHNLAQEDLTNDANKIDSQYKRSIAASTRDMTDSNIVKNQIGNLNSIAERTARVTDLKSAADLKKEQSLKTRAETLKTYVNIGTDGINAATKIFDSVANLVPGIGATSKIGRSINKAVPAGK